MSTPSKRGITSTLSLDTRAKEAITLAVFANPVAVHPITMITLPLLTLPLFVARVGTNHVNNTATTDYLAFIANPFHTRANFHLPDS
jgi:hypothetical protein